MANVDPLVRYYGPEDTSLVLGAVADVVYATPENTGNFVERALTDSTLTAEDQQVLALVRPEILETVMADRRSETYAA